MHTNIVDEIVKLCTSLGQFKQTFETSLDTYYLEDAVDVMLDCPEKPDGYNIKLTQVERPKGVDSICLTSGGADSTIAWYMADKPMGLYIDIGQPYAYKEICALEKCGIEHKYIDLRNTKLGLSSWGHIIPGRNLLFLTIAAELLDDEGELHFAVISGEGYESGRGDKSREFLRDFIYWYEKEQKKSINIITYDEKTKGQWLKTFIEEGHDPNIIRFKTITCFSATDKPCGRCQACLRKYLSFLYNNINIAEDFEINPMIGGSVYVAKYKKVLAEALDMQDFSHYSPERCQEDLAAIVLAENALT